MAAIIIRSTNKTVKYSFGYSFCRQNNWLQSTEYIHSSLTAVLEFFLCLHPLV